MIYVAFRMLVGDRVKYLGLIFGVAFSTLLIVQQASIFVRVLELSAYLVTANPEIDVWVTRPGIGATEIVEQMPEGWLTRVRGVSGVAWATPLYRGGTTARGADGEMRNIGLIGVDDATLIGAPTVMLAGDIEDLRGPDKVIADIATFKRLFGDIPITEQPTIEIGKRRVKIVGVCRAVKTITGGEIIYARRSVAVRLTQEPNNTVSFALVKVQPGVPHERVARAIEEQTGLVAKTRQEFNDSIIDWTMENTGIVQVLGSVILLGIIIGMLVVGQTFYLFAYENRKNFAALKAMGASRSTITLMLCFQAMFVTVLGYCIGLGGATLVLYLGDTDLSPMRDITLSAPVALVTALAMPAMVLGTAILAARGLVNGDPAIVFK
jgi:putative ABC transport system permease protein